MSRGLCALYGEFDSEYGALAGNALAADRASVVHNAVLDNGKSQTRSLDLSGAAFVHPVEALEDTPDRLGRDTDTVVADGDEYLLRDMGDLHLEVSALGCR